MTTFYVFYIRTDFNDSLEFPIDIPSLKETNPIEYIKQGVEVYAVTHSKPYASMFRKYRNMDQFVEKTIYIDDDELADFTIDYSMHFIGKHPLRTSYLDHGKKVRGSIVIPMTAFEADQVSMNGTDVFVDKLYEIDYQFEEEIIDEIGLMTTDIFIPEVRKLFDRVNLLDFVSQLPPLEEFPWDTYAKLNEVIVYQELFGVTYREGGLKELCESGDFI